MSGLRRVVVATLNPDRFQEAVTAEQYAEFTSAAERGRHLLHGKVVFNINSTGRGGGVAEMLRSLLAYARGAGIDARWLVIPGTPDFFQVTKRLHNHLHGAPGDGGDLGDAEHAIYKTSSSQAAEGLLRLVKPGDIAIVHDPQPAALVPVLKEAGVAVIWRCHVGLDTPNDLARGAWHFLKPHVEPAHAYVFSRDAFVWEGLNRDRIAIVPPSIDAFSAKNQEMRAPAVTSILTHAGIVAGSSDAPPTYTREDGSPGRVDGRARVVGEAPVPEGVPIVTQVSRWDRLKDPVGVIEGFVDRVAPAGDAHLVVAGPDVEAVADDPEGAEVLGLCRSKWESLRPPERERVHLASLPMNDGEENAAIVNALQRRSDVVVQKSIAEGFGLTVAEAMWKGRPVVASRIGGIQDQITHEDNGLLVDDPRDLDGYGDAVVRLLDNASEAERLGRNAQTTVRERFLGTRHLGQYLDLIERVLGGM